MSNQGTRLEVQSTVVSCWAWVNNKLFKKRYNSELKYKCMQCADDMELKTVRRW